MKIFRKQSWLSFGVGFSIWTPVGLSSGSASHIALVRKGVESSWLQSVLYHLTYYYLQSRAAFVIF